MNPAAENPSSSSNAASSKPGGPEGASSLYRSPTWARNIDFDSSFDLNTASSADNSGYASPVDDGTTGIALGGSPRLGGHGRASRSIGQSEVDTVSQRSSTQFQQQHQQQSTSRSPSSHARQSSSSNVPATPLRSSPTMTMSDRSTPKANQIVKSNMSSMLPSHQRVASASSFNGMLDWSRPAAPAQHHSSADLYAVNPPIAESGRPETSLSMLSASIDGGKEERRDSNTSNDAPIKRASVLSFQTALSGVGGYDDVNNAVDAEHLDRTLPQRPWLAQQPVEPPSGPASSFGTSPDERYLPGGWGASRPWNQSGTEEMVMSPSPRFVSPLASRSASVERGRNSASQSPAVRPQPLEDTSHAQTQRQIRASPPSASPRTSPNLRQHVVTLPPASSIPEQRSARPKSLLRNDTTEELLSSTAPGNPLSPISGDMSTMHGPTQDAQEQRAKPDRSDALPESGEIGQRAEYPLGAAKEGITATQIAEDEHMDEPQPPALPEKSAPPAVPAKNEEVGLSSPPLSDNAAPPPDTKRQEEDVARMTNEVPADRSPVLDFRRKPLMAIDSTDDERWQARSPEGSNGASRDIAAATDPPVRSPVARVGPGVGAHAARNSGADQLNAPPAFAAHMQGPSAGPKPQAVAASAPALPATTADTSPSPSIETPPREASPPPEGEVEARAEWERAQMRQAAERAKREGNATRKTTFRGQLKPLQLVAAEESKRAERNGPNRDSFGLSQLGTPVSNSPMDEGKLSPLESKSTGGFDAGRTAAGAGTVAAVAAAAAAARQASDPIPSRGSPTALVAVNGRASSGGMSTQQLQRQVARDQRHSVNAVNIALGQKGVSDIGGAYPVFSSPSTSAVNVGSASRRYAGLMPQRSLVPPFELQNRPDGLPSALTGPDGVRRSPNDPEVCLECMMRDEDMIDVHVLGAGLWERESDREFDEAIRLEEEENVRREREKAAEPPESTGTHGANLDTNTMMSSSGIDADKEGRASSPLQPRARSPAQPRAVSPVQPRLTKIRVKRVARGDPLTAERLKLHTQMNPPASSHRWRTLQTFLSVQAKYIALEQKARGLAPAVPPKQEPSYDNRMVRTVSADSKSAHRQRVASAGLFQVAEVPLNEEEKAQKEKDIVGAREARRRNHTSGLETARGIRGNVETGGAATEETGLNRLSGSMLPNDDSTGHQSIPRRSNAGPSQFVRGVSAQDLRSIPNAMPGGKADIVSSPSSLAPPSVPFRAAPMSPTPPVTGNRMRAVSSQMSLAGSGSMIDMHVGMEDRKEHRISQAGFMPGTPLHSQSPSALNRAFYGFPGDMDPERGDYDPVTSFGEYDDSYNTSRGSPELERKKKKSGGLRSLFGGKKSAAKESTYQQEDSTDLSKRRSSFGLDAALELQPPPGIGGLLNRARRSTSSLLAPSGRQSMDSTHMLADRGYNNPLMASQTSLELGPFGSGPLPPPRKESRFFPALVSRPDSPQQKDKSRLRTFSSGNLMSKRKTAAPIPNPSSRSSSIMQPGLMQSNGQEYQPRPYGEGIGMGTPQQQGGGDREASDRSSAGSLLTGQRRDISMQSAPGDPRAGNGSFVGAAENPAIRQSTLVPAYPSHGGGRTGPVMQQQRANRSEGFLPIAGGMSSADVSVEGGSAPRRPPRSPHREISSEPPSEHLVKPNDAMRASMSHPLAIPPSLQKEQFLYAYDAPPQSRNDLSMQQQSHERYLTYGPTSPISPSDGFPSSSPQPAAASSRKSRLLKLPFGKNKRESTAMAKPNGATGKATPSLRSRSSRGTFDETPRQSSSHYDALAASSITNTNGYKYGSAQQPGFDALRGGLGWSKDRPHVSSSSSMLYDDRGLPPRSQSAMGLFDGPPPSSPSSGGMRSLLPRLRTSSRAALREVRED